MRVLYFDCIAGISGDKALGALIDAGADLERIAEDLAKLPVEPFDIDTETGEFGGVRATRLTTRVEEAGIIRTYGSVRTLLGDAGIPDDAHELAQRILLTLAEAEAVVHHKELDTVTFHEPGAVRTLVAVTGVALAVSSLGLDRCFSSAVPTGFGMTRTEHGAMLIPAPSVTEILKGAPLYSRGVPAELVTPTGAAILATLCEDFGDLPLLRLDAVGYGAGYLELDFPDVLRVMIGEASHEEADAEPTPKEGEDTQ
jgi:pyridinium-3,5-bisthiocarboxylic acid mononucleotide nickel chelatase